LGQGYWLAGDNVFAIILLGSRSFYTIGENETCCVIAIQQQPHRVFEIKKAALKAAFLQY
jgi:hypothetical protein